MSSRETCSIEQNASGNLGWTKVCSEFADANIYQTWPYEVVQSGESNVSGVAFRKDSTIFGAAQARILRLPLLGIGIAYVLGGPLWRSKNATINLDAFRQNIRALRSEYVGRRKHCLRINPQPGDYDVEAVRRILDEERYISRQHSKVRKTILMDVRPSGEALYEGLHAKWRHDLKKAGKQNLEMVQGEDDAHFDAFEQIHAEMVDRKQLVGMTDISKLKLVQRGLSAKEKMAVVLCKSQGKACAGGVCSAIGDTAIYLHGATNSEGMKTQGSYLVHWAMLKWVKERGCSWYDLNGINPAANPGVYRFKSRLAGTYGREIEAVGQFDAYPSAMVKLLVRFGERLRSRVRKVRAE